MSPPTRRRLITMHAEDDTFLSHTVHTYFAGWDQTIPHSILTKPTTKTLAIDWYYDTADGSMSQRGIVLRNRWEYNANDVTSISDTWLLKWNIELIPYGHASVHFRQYAGAKDDVLMALKHLMPEAFRKTPQSSQWVFSAHRLLPILLSRYVINTQYGHVAMEYTVRDKVTYGAGVIEYSAPGAEEELFDEWVGHRRRLDPFVVMRGPLGEHMLNVSQPMIRVHPPTLEYHSPILKHNNLLARTLALDAQRSHLLLVMAKEKGHPNVP